MLLSHVHTKLMSTFILLSLLVPEGIILPVVSTSALTWFIRYIYYYNLQFLNNLIIKLWFSFLRHRWPQPIQAILCRSFGFIAPKTLIYLAFWFWAHLMKVIHEKRLRFIASFIPVSMATLYVKILENRVNALWSLN